MRRLKKKQKILEWLLRAWQQIVVVCIDFYYPSQTRPLWAVANAKRENSQKHTNEVLYKVCWLHCCHSHSSPSVSDRMLSKTLGNGIAQQKQIMTLTTNSTHNPIYYNKSSSRDCNARLLFIYVCIFLFTVTTLASPYTQDHHCSALGRRQQAMLS